MTFGEASPKRQDRRGLWLALAGLVVLLGGLYAVGYATLSDRMPIGTRIAGVDVGMMTTTDARTKIQEDLGGRSDDPIRLVSGEQDFPVDPADAGLSFDLEATIVRAGAGTDWNPVRMVRVLTGSDRVAPVVSVDDEALDRTVAKIADSIDDPAVEGKIAFSGVTPVVRQPQVGSELDRERTRELIVESYLVNDDIVPLPVTAAPPAVSSDEMAAAVTKIARPAVAGPVRMRAGGRTVVLRPQVYAPATSVVVRDGKLVTVVDADRLAPRLTRATRKVDKSAENARIVVRKGKPKIIASKPGIKIEAEPVATRIVPALAEKGSRRSFTIAAARQKPAFTTKQAKALGIKQKVSSFTTRYPHARYRNVNQGRAAKKIDGTLLEPGETFSFNRTVGERTVESGFTEGYVIDSGVLREDLGGGVSQVATTLYNAAFFAGLEDVTHKPHSFYISRYPVGREATVAWPTVDLKFRNDTKHGILIRAWVDRSKPGRQGAMHVDMWGTKTWRITAGQSARRNFRSPGTITDSSDRCVDQQGIAGFDIDIYRNFYRGGKRVDRERQTASYDAADTVRCTG